jgi:hypothetical protein
VSVRNRTTAVSMDLLGALGIREGAAPELAHDADVPERQDRRHKHGEPYSDDLIVARIHQWATRFGGPPTKTDWDGPKSLPKMGAEALRGYVREVAQARLQGDQLRLKASLYTLAMSAIREADRIDGDGS